MRIFAMSEVDKRTGAVPGTKTKGYGKNNKVCKVSKPNDCLR